MRKLTASITICLLLQASCVGSQTKKGAEVSVKGTVMRVVGVGGESTGWLIQFTKPTQIEGRTLQSIEVQAPTQQLVKLENRVVEATGKVATRHGVERGDWQVLQVDSLRDAESK